MSKGTIISHIAGGEYNVTLNYNRANITAMLDTLGAKETGLIALIAAEPDDLKKRLLRLQLLSVQKRIEFLNNTDRAPNDETITAWCADLTTSLTGEVGLIEIGREKANGLNIQPGYDSNAVYDGTRDGEMVPLMAQHPAATFYNLAMLPGTQKWKPTYLYGVISNIDYATDSADVVLYGTRSSQQSLNIVQDSEYVLTDVPVVYMNCNASAFEDGDHVLVHFKDFDFEQPEIIGFMEEPQSCNAGFILIISSQSGDEAFAWDINTNTLLVEKGSLPSVQAAVIEMGASAGTLMIPSNSLYDNWWGAEPDCGDYPAGDAGEDGFNDGVWPSYFSIDYYKMEAADCVNQSNRKISKLNYPTFYQGVIPSLGDPDFDYDAGLTVPKHNHNVAPFAVVYAPREEWMIPYVKYVNPVTGETEKLKAAYIVEKYGQYTVSSVPIEHRNPCGLPSPPWNPASVFRSFEWFHSLFGFEMNDLDGEWWYAAKDNMDNLSDFLFDTWDDDVHLEPVGEECHATAETLMDFGIAKNKNGAAVYDFATVGWGLNHGGLSGNAKYLGAATGERSQVFRVYTSSLIRLNGLAYDCWEALNVKRVENGLKKFSVNACLCAAAERHALDLAENFITGEYSHNGSDGSTVTSRFVDSGYLLWRNIYQPVGGGENIGGVFSADPVSAVMSGWRNSPPHWAAIINGDFIEVGVAHEVNRTDSADIFVVVFGFRTDVWAGFAPLDTTDILTYMNTNFLWAGAGDNIQVPKIYLA